MTVSDYVAAFLHERGVGQVFELVGGMITHLVDSLGRAGKVRVISVHHEQAAGFAADAVGRITGIPGVAMATSGPGATNLLTAIGGAYFDSVPTVFITGQVNRHEQKGNRRIRQLGFQETDIVAMATPVTKMAWLVQTPEEVPEVLDRAFAVAMSGRPGPVLIDIPMDVQRCEIEVRKAVLTEHPTNADRTSCRVLCEHLFHPDLPLTSPLAQEFLAEMLECLKRSERPLILSGGGLRSSRSIPAFRQFVELAGVPVVHSLMGVDVLPFGHPSRVGMIGTYGNRWANQAMARADFLLVLGSRMDVRQTGSQAESFSQGKTIFHVDCEPGEMNNRVRGCRTLASDLGSFLLQALHAFEGEAIEISRWKREIEAARNSWPDVAELADIPGINPNAFFHELSRHDGSKDASAYTVDVGQHQMWAAQSLEIGPDQRFLTSGGMGAMGYALPAAIGAAISVRHRPVIMIAGDGGFQLNIQELQTIARNHLPIKMIVINNRCHGMVRQFQQSYFEGRYQSTRDGYSTPDFSMVAKAYGIDSCRVDGPTEVFQALNSLWSEPGAPFLLEVIVDTFANAYPKLAFGRPVSEMEPLVASLDMEAT